MTELQIALGVLTPTLTVTINGFEVGNTRADCTFSFASTIPGVTFSDTDILAVVWLYRNGNMWDLMSYNASFRANTSYQVLICLDPKGLTEAPAATVNGKTAESKISDNNQLTILCELGTPAYTLTIHGADTVCAQQDYKFTVTAPEGVGLYSEFRYDDTVGNFHKFPLDIDKDGVGHGVIPKEYYLGIGFNLKVYDKEMSVEANKFVQVSQEHIYVDGKCGCGAEQQYTVTYDFAHGTLPADRQNPETITVNGTIELPNLEGFGQRKFLGWQIVGSDDIEVYQAGREYVPQEDMTFVAVYDEYITVSAPFTTTVKLGDAGEPGEKTFTLEVLSANAGDASYADVSVSGSVDTNGAGSYNGSMSFTGPESQLRNMLSEGAFVQQVDDGAEGWTVDDTVYGLVLEETQAADRSLDDSVPTYTLRIFPTVKDGDNYTIVWGAGEWLDKMTFTNTYSAHVYTLNHDADGHWDECACGHKKNEESHKYGDWTVTREATETATGEKEHTCTVCGYTEKAEIDKLAATDKTSPQTGDNSHMALWIALLVASVLGIAGTTVYSRRKRVR